jgi:hypothetical protein
VSSSVTLNEIIEQALIAVRAHPQHDLELGYRQAIWAALEAPTDGTEEAKNIGRKRRLLLAILSAKHVLPIWEKMRPDDTIPHNLLTKAERSLFEKVESLLDDFSVFATYMNNINYEPAVMAGESAAMTLSTALWDEKFDPANIDYNLTNADLDPDYSDAALLASVAYANGSIWEPSSDPEKRCKFWEWWLTEAVPMAWQAFP